MPMTLADQNVQRILHLVLMNLITKLQASLLIQVSHLLDSKDCVEDALPSKKDFKSFILVAKNSGPVVFEP